MTFRTSSFALAIVLGGWMAACGGSTTIGFVGEPGGAGGGETGGAIGEGGSGGDTGGSGLGGLGGDGPGSGGSGGSGGGGVITFYCGDGNIDVGEACDDANERSRDGCSSTCEIEPPFVCTGEPSECTLFGNGTVDFGEECDDGNFDDGDGCSAGAEIEGTCSDPVAIDLNTDGVIYSGSVETASFGGGGTVPAGACAGLSSGAGPDRVFSIDVPLDGKLDLTLSTDFDAIMRITLADACGSPDAGVCVDDGGSTAGERVVIDDAAAGTYLVVVDGAEEGEQGDIGIDVELCAIEQVVSFIKIERVTLYQQQVVLKNTHPTCSFDLSRLQLALVDDSGFAPSALPAVVLQPGQEQRFAGKVNGNNAGSLLLAGGPVTWFDTGAASVYLCFGVCDQLDGSNIVDLFHSGTISPTPPAPALFSPGALTSLGQFSSVAVYQRAAYAGAYPDFQASDYAPALYVAGDDFAIISNASNYGSVVASSFVADSTEGTVFHPASATGLNYGGIGIAVPPGAQNPTYISFKTRSDLAGSDACYLLFGQNNASLGTAWDYVNYAFDYAVGTTTANQLVVAAGYAFQYAEEADQWHRVEYRNIDWTAGTFDVYVDGAVAIVGAFMVSNLGSLNTVYFMPWAAGEFCYYDELLVYNGPPVD